MFSENGGMKTMLRSGADPLERQWFQAGAAAAPLAELPQAPGLQCKVTFTPDFKNLDEEAIRLDVRHSNRQGFTSCTVSAKCQASRARLQPRRGGAAAGTASRRKPPRNC